MADVERRDRDPCGAVVQIERERRRHERTDVVDLHRPVREQEIAPALSHDPRRARERPWAVADVTGGIFGRVEHEGSVEAAGASHGARFDPERSSQAPVALGIARCGAISFHARSVTRIVVTLDRASVYVCIQRNRLVRRY